MTKFATFRVQVPIDDPLPVQQVQAHLQKVLEERNTETLNVKPSDETGGLMIDAPNVGRVHWPAVDVRQAMERTAPAPPVVGRRKRGP